MADYSQYGGIDPDWLALNLEADPDLSHLTVLELQALTNKQREEASSPSVNTASKWPSLSNQVTLFILLS